jgi:hypothetical protein
VMTPPGLSAEAASELAGGERRLEDQEARGGTFRLPLLRARSERRRTLLYEALS